MRLAILSERACVFDHPMDDGRWACACGNATNAPGKASAACRLQATRPPRTIGLGDMVAGAIKVATFGLVKLCGGCKERQAALNKVQIPLP